VTGTTVAMTPDDAPALWCHQ